MTRHDSQPTTATRLRKTTYDRLWMHAKTKYGRNVRIVDILSDVVEEWLKREKAK